LANTAIYLPVTGRTISTNKERRRSDFHGRAPTGSRLILCNAIQCGVSFLCRKNRFQQSAIEPPGTDPPARRPLSGARFDLKPSLTWSPGVA
jgi:hypothetical protein